MTGSALRHAESLMEAFAQRTGLVPPAPPRRYLWTDAFAVCNCLGLARATRDERWADLALALVDQVHHVLGRHHPDDPRSGWISGLAGEAGEAHPTRGGLRIGKPLPERGPGEPLDERREWDRDGQYFHYLTKWMHALDQVSRFTGDRRFHLWARELAEAARGAFVAGPSGRRRMVWKMSTDLSRPLVPSMGQHDPLDGYVTALQLEATAARWEGGHIGPSLQPSIEDYGAMLAATDVRTTDPLGLGGLLTDAARVAQLAPANATEGRELLAGLLAAALDGLARYARAADWRRRADRRLAFRELGLAVGLAATPLLENAIGTSPGGAARELVASLREYAPLGEAIERFWLEPAHQATAVWDEHRDIDEVMLATRLVPAGFLVLEPGAPAA